MLRRIITLVALPAPFLALAYLWLNPSADQRLAVPIAHFYIVTFTTFSAAVISILMLASLGGQATLRHTLAATGFMTIGAIFFTHGLATPGALTEVFHPAAAWSAWLTLFTSGVLFALAGFSGWRGLPRWITPRGVSIATFISLVVYFSILAFAPHWLTHIQEATNPTLRLTLFYISLILWALAALMLWLTWRRSRSQVDGMLAFVAVWLAIATISLHQFPLWNYSWWIYHLLLLGAFLIGAYILAKEYEQVRQFRLSSYYLALSLIVTALLALGASILFTNFVYNLLVGEIRSTSADIANNLAVSLANDYSQVANSEEFRRLTEQGETGDMLTQRLVGLPILAAFVYDDQGLSVAANEPEFIGVRVDDQAAFAAALRGETQVTVRPPNTQMADYAPPSSVDVIATFAPVRRSPESAVLGVLAILQEAPEIQSATINARLTGLLTAAVSMGLLFVALLSVVGRADRILTSRTEELRQVSERLKTYSQWLLGKSLLERLLADPNALGLMRRERTVLFMDIRSFTGWSEEHSPEQVVDMLNRYYNMVERIMEKYQAIRFKFAADEAMGVFDTSHLAARAALELATEVNTLLAGHALGVGIGLHTGPLVEGLLGSMGVRFYDVIGDTVNTAKRIEGSAKAWQVLISEATHSSLGEDGLSDEPFFIEIKGKDQPVKVYKLISCMC